MICNKYIYDFWKTVVYVAIPAMQLQGWQTMIICQRRSQLGKNKEIILYLMKKKKYEKKARSVDECRTSVYFLCFKISDPFQL